MALLVDSDIARLFKSMLCLPSVENEVKMSVKELSPHPMMSG